MQPISFYSCHGRQPSDGRTILQLEHNAGFFSCCSVKLQNIIDYFNTYQCLPDIVDGSKQFALYKSLGQNNNQEDITFDFFEHYDTTNIDIPYNARISNFPINDWLAEYKHLNYTSVQPFIEKYFKPTKEILANYEQLISESEIDVNNCIAVYIRGTDKYMDTALGSHDEYYTKIQQVIDMNPSCQVLLQTDDGPFLDFIKEKNIHNLITFNKTAVRYDTNGAHMISEDQPQHYNDMKYLLAIFLIISKCKYILCNSSNCSVFIMYYRGNATNVYQYSKQRWVEG